MDWFLYDRDLRHERVEIGHTLTLKKRRKKERRNILFNETEIKKIFL